QSLNVLLSERQVGFRRVVEGSMERILTLWILASFILTAACATAAAQGASAQITGTVKDESGAVRAAVESQHPKTGQPELARVGKLHRQRSDAFVWRSRGGSGRVFPGETPSMDCARLRVSLCRWPQDRVRLLPIPTIAGYSGWSI